MNKCSIEGIMFTVSQNKYLCIKTVKQLLHSYISGPSNLLLDKRNSIDAFNYKVLVKSFSDRSP